MTIKQNGGGLEATVDAAIQQILSKKYAASLEAKGISRDKIRVYGFAFKGKRVLIGGGNIIGVKSLYNRWKQDGTDHHKIHCYFANHQHRK